MILLQFRGGVFNDNVEFTLGYVCNRPVKPGDAAANTVLLQTLPNTIVFHKINRLM